MTATEPDKRAPSLEVQIAAAERAVMDRRTRIEASTHELGQSVRQRVLLPGLRIAALGLSARALLKRYMARPATSAGATPGARSGKVMRLANRALQALGAIELAKPWLRRLRRR